MDTLLQRVVAQLQAMIEEGEAQSEQEQQHPPREGPKDYVDLPDGTRINSSTPRAKP